MRHAAAALWVILLLLANVVVMPSQGRAQSLYGYAAWTAPEEAEQGHSEGHKEIYRWINFLLLAGAMVYLSRKPLAEFFTQRSAAVRKALDEGRKALENSQALLSAVEARLRHLEDEIAAFKASAAREMESERQRLRESAAAETERIRESTRAQIELALRSARMELRIQAAQQAVELAEEMIRQRLDDAGRSRLFNRFLTGLEAKERKN